MSILETPPYFPKPTMPRYCLLEETAAIEVRGPDAQAFLDAQLTRDVPAAPPADAAADGTAAPAPLAAWCDARGRVRAVFRVLRITDGYLLVTERAMVAAVLSQLAKYVLRSRVTLRAADWRFGAVLEADAAWRAANGLERLAASEAVHRGGLAFVGVGPAFLLVASPGTSAAGGAGASHPNEALDTFGATLEPAPATAAVLAAIRLGLPAITPATTERFVAQMLNLDVLDAVSFSKGCYPGQEVIARIRYRGEVKRRLKRFATPDTELPAPGSEVVDAAGTHVGDVVTAAPAESGIELLAVVDLAAHDARLADGRALTEQPLPGFRRSRSDG